MSKQRFIESDNGKVIFNTATNCYYCGMNTFKNQLRDAKIYHSQRYLNEAIKTLINGGRIHAENIEIRVVETKVVNRYRYIDPLKVVKTNDK